MTNDGSCLSLKGLQAIYDPIDTVNFEWDEFDNPISNSNLMLFGNYGMWYEPILFSACILF